MGDAADHFGRFASLFLDALLLVSRDGVIRGANRAARLHVLGARSVGAKQNLTELIEDDCETFLTYLRLCARSGDPLPGALTLRSRDDDPVSQTFRCDGSAFEPYDDGEPLVVLRLTPKESAVHRFMALNEQIEQLTREVARRVRAEREVSTQREMLRVTLASIGDGVITTDVEGRITFMNPVAEAHTGWGQQTALGLPLETVFDIRNEETGERVESPVAKVLETGVVAGLANHTVLIHRDSTQLPIDDSGAPIRDASGRLLGVVLVFHEISERRKMERELARQAGALREADDRKNQFLAMLAHELRNPLAALHNAVQLLRAGSPIPRDRLAGMMERQTRQLTRLIDDLLDISRITRGSIRLNKAPTPLAAVIEHAVETSRPVVEQNSHRLTVDLPADPLVVNVDLARISQVLCNLLTNASKFMEPGGDIAVIARAEAGHAVVSVRDSGVGLSESFLPHVFDMFSQGDRGLDRAHGGLGIGLALVKTLVDMHGGEVSAFSAGPGTGSEFAIRLPLETAERPATGAPGAEQRPLLRTRVLIADDNVDAAESLAMLLTGWGCEVQIAQDGPSVLEVARAANPDAILLDIGLPGIDGLEVVRRLRRSPGRDETLLVAVTGYGSETDRRRSMEAGFDHHLAKPVDFDALRTLLS